MSFYFLIVQPSADGWNGATLSPAQKVEGFATPQAALDAAKKVILETVSLQNGGSFALVGEEN